MYQEMVSLLQYILRQFFKCAEINGCVFVELLFRKVHENPKGALLESHTSEFSAVLDNYNDEEYSRILERMKAGETLDAMRSKQRAVLDGSLPWTEAEDAVLQERYQMYADHPLCADLLAAELPEDSHRTARQVRRRLAELGLVNTRGQRPQGADERGGDAARDVDSGAESPPAKKQKRVLDLDEVEVRAADQDQAAAGAVKHAAAASRATAAATQIEDDETLEMDLERLLDAAMDVDGGDTFLDTAAEGLLGPRPAEVDAAPAAEAGAPSGTGDLEVDLELELEAMMEEGGLDLSALEPQPPATSAVAAPQASAGGPPEAAAAPSAAPAPAAQPAPQPAAVTPPAAARPASPHGEDAEDSLPQTQPSLLQAPAGPGATWLQSEFEAMLGGGFRPGGAPDPFEDSDMLASPRLPAWADSLQDPELFGEVLATPPTSLHQGPTSGSPAAAMSRGAEGPSGAGADEEDATAQRFWEGMGQANPTASQRSDEAGASQPCTLELDLEKIMDEGLPDLCSPADLGG